MDSDGERQTWFARPFKLYFFFLSNPRTRGLLGKNNSILSGKWTRAGGSNRGPRDQISVKSESFCQPSVR